jgi:hypothetical protein
MALQSSGAISMTQIYAEVTQVAHNGSSSFTLHNMATTANQYGGGFNVIMPTAMSEFYGWAYYYPPSVSTDSVTGVTLTGATLNGTLASWGSETPSSKGFYIGTSGTPTNNDAYTVAGTGTGAFSLVLTNQLAANTVYYVNAFAQTSGRPIVIASQISFTTTSAAACEVISSAFASTAQGACIGSARNYRYDTTDFFAATWVRSGLDTTCTGAYQSAGYFSNFNIWRYWNGTAFTSQGGCA